MELPSIVFGVNALYGSCDKENELLMKSRRGDDRIIDHRSSSIIFDSFRWW